MSVVRWPAALLFAVTTAVAAPVPKELTASKGVYFPTAVGTRWEYVREGTDAVDHSRVVSAEETDKDGTRTVAFEWTSVGGQYTKSSLYRVDKRFVRRTGWTRTQSFEVPCVMWDADAKAGDKWTAGIVGPKEKSQFTATRGAAEVVTTPAGKFEAVPVAIQAGADVKNTNTYWYAPGVGLVKWESGARTVVLSKFTHGKEIKK